MKYLAFLLLLIPATVVASSKIVRNSMGGDIDVTSAPHGAVLRTMGGDIEVDSAGGTVIAKTMGGDIRVERLTGSIEAGTMGGSVEVEVLGAGTGRAIKITSLGGRVEVILPKAFAADFEIELEQDDDDDGVHRINSDFPLQITESTRRHWFKKVVVLKGTGRNGAGGNRVRLSSIGGDITIRRR
jgi:DUF4097 and DUF4098 domain-containing protein YvlB